MRFWATDFRHNRAYFEDLGNKNRLIFSSKIIGKNMRKIDLENSMFN